MKWILFFFFIQTYVLFDRAHAQFADDLAITEMANDIVALSNESNAFIFDDNLSIRDLKSEIRQSSLPPYEKERLIEELEQFETSSRNAYRSKAAPLVAAAGFAVYRSLRFAWQLYKSNPGSKARHLLRKTCTKADKVYHKAQSKFSRTGKCDGEPDSKCGIISKENKECFQQALKLMSIKAELSRFELTGRELVMDMCAKSGVGEDSRGRPMEVEKHEQAILDIKSRLNRCTSFENLIKAKINAIDSKPSNASGSGGTIYRPPPPGFGNKPRGVRTNQ